MTHTNARYRPLLLVLLFLLTVTTLAALAVRYAEPVTDGDIWFHLAYGRYFVENHTLTVDHSIFSWTPAHGVWIYCAWISQSILYLLHEAWGFMGLYALRFAFIILFLVFVLAMAPKKAAYVPTMLLVCLGGLLMAQAGLRIKADLFSFLFMTCLVFLWFRFRSDPASRRGLLLVIPVLFLLWVNAHPGFIFGAVFLALVFIGEAINQLSGSPEKLDSRTLSYLFLACVLSAAAVFITPYGWTYPFHLLDELVFSSERFYRDIRSLMEYQSIFYPDASPLHFIDHLVVSSCILAALVFLQVKNRRTDWTVLLVNAAFLVLYMKYLRLTYYWAIVFVFSAAYLLRRQAADGPGIMVNKPVRAGLQAIVVCLVLFYSFRATYESLCSPNIGYNAAYHPPAAEAEYIRTHYPSLRMGNDYDSGTYLLWSLWPEKKVFLDARYFPFSQWYGEYTAFADTTDGNRRDLFLEKYPCDLWCLSYNDLDLVRYFLDSEDWRLVHYSTSGCVFLSRRAKPAEDRVVADIGSPSSLYETIRASHFAFLAGEYPAAKKLVMNLTPCPLCPGQKGLAYGSMVSLGDEFSNRQRFSDAVDLFASAIRISPHAADAYLKKGNAEIQMKRIPEAMITFRKALALDPDLDMAHNSLGNAYMLLDKPEDALACYSEALRINPGNAAALKNRSMAEECRKLDAGIAQVRERLERNPGDLALTRTLSVLYAKKGAYDKALAGLMEIVRRTPEDPVVYYNIACMYSRMDNASESLAWLERAIRKGFDDWPLLKRDPDLAAVRGTEAYRVLVRGR